MPRTSHHTSLGAVALTAPRSLLRFTFRKRAAACARESATARPWAHCSAFCQDVPREVNPIVHGREKTIGLSCDRRSQPCSDDIGV